MIIAYRKANAEAIRAIIEAKRDGLRNYVSKINQDTPIKEVWEMLRKFKGKQRTSNRPIRYLNNYHYSKEQKSSAIGKHYQKIMTKQVKIEY